MNNINNISDLKRAINMLEMQLTNDEQLLRGHFKDTIESLKPINFIKHTFSEITTSPEIKESLLSSIIGLATGYVSKKIVIGSTHNPIKQIFGTILQIGVTGAAAKNADEIKSVLSSLFNKLFRKKAPKT